MRISRPYRAPVFALDHRRLKKVDLATIERTIKSIKQFGSLEGRPEFGPNSNGLAAKSHPCVNRIRRNYTGLASRKDNLAVAYKEARTAGDDLESFFLHRMNVPMLAPQPECRVIDGLPDHVHREYLALGLAPGLQELHPLSGSLNDLPLKIALATGSPMEAV
jgi:hypothetical protein